MLCVPHRQTIQEYLDKTFACIHLQAYVIHHTSCSIQHIAYSIQNTSYIIHHTSYIIHHTSYSIHHTSYSTHTPACDVRQSSRYYPKWWVSWVGEARVWNEHIHVTCREPVYVCVCVCVCVRVRHAFASCVRVCVCESWISRPDNIRPWTFCLCTGYNT